MRSRRKVAQRVVLACAITLVAFGCAKVDNLPLNVQAAPMRLVDAPPSTDALPAHVRNDDRLIAVVLSGGGSRAAAFGWGALSELAATPTETGTLADQIGVVSGVSAGAILGAFFVRNGVEGLPAFRTRFLDVDVEAALRNGFGPANLARALHGGVNDREGLPRWLTANLLGTATFGDIGGAGQPRLLLHATDLQNRAPFLFDQTSFDTICSDRDSFPLAEAVAATAAVPVIFAPVILKNYRDSCAFDPPPAPAAAPLSALDAHLRRTMTRYSDLSENRYLKLNDGGLVDNLGTLGLILAAGRDGSEAAPFEAARAYRAKRVLVLVVDGSTRVGRETNASLKPTGLGKTVLSAVDAMIDISSRQSLDSLQRWLPGWREGLIAERCSRSLPDCRDLRVDLVRIALEDLTDPVAAKKFADSKTALKLTPEMVDFFAGSAVDLLRRDPVFQSFIR
jgi:NTE family protein